MNVLSHPRITSFIDGRPVSPGGRDAFENIDPATGEVVSVVEVATAGDVDHAVSAARKALTGPWGRLTLDQRARALHAIADGIEERFDDFLKAEMLDTGKPVTLASHLDIPRGAANFRAFAETLKHAPGEFFPMVAPDGGDAINYSLRGPRGVIGVICPWNLPFLLMTWKVAPALACGNTVVVKPSEETPAPLSIPYLSPYLSTTEPKG